ncbi:Signal transduction histidine kinase [Ulvibacter litoralis]|uniref:histidine kinase n=2 Tax=Ulvibacter litoralis TaxID=227084 RepID=A0A1G7FWH9_9FLAO|nr:Signal transduction histidine kinase [Ulvibacter litoralis]
MWFGTTQGLLKYDGYSFKIYNNNPNNPNFIENEQLTEHNTIYQVNNSLWFAANNTVFKLNTKTDSIITYTETHGIKGDVIELHIDDKKQVWVVSDNHWTSKREDTYQYLQKFDEKHGFQVIDSLRRGSREFTRLTSDQKNNLWWSTLTKGTIKYTENGKRLQNYDLNTSGSDGKNKYRGTSFFDSKNLHYYFPSNKGITRYNTSKSEWESILNEPLSIHHAAEDNEGNIWFAGDAFFYRMDRFGNFTDFSKTAQEQVDFTRISELFVDNNGLLWVATDNGILKLRIKPKIFTQLFKSNEKDWGNAMRSIFETKSGDIIGLCEREKKLMVFSPNIQEGKELELWGDYNATTNPLHGARFFSMDLDKEYAYTVNEDLVKIRLKDGFTTVFAEFANRLNITGASPIITLKDGRLLFGFTLAKLTIYTPETGESELVFKDPIEKDYLHFRYFLESNTSETVWVGTVNNGLLKINLNGTIEAHYDLNSDPPLNKNNIMVIHENKDESLWLGTFGGGIIHLTPHKKEAFVYDTSSGLANNNVVGILPYNDDHLLVSTYDGLSFFNMKTKRFHNFFEEDGLTHNEFNYTSFFKDSNSNYYFGGMNGINMFNPKNLTRDTLINPILFSSLTRFNSKSNDIQKTDFSYAANSKVTITPYDQYFQVNWTIPNYFKNIENQYFTKLEGYENTWFSQGINPYVRYNKLPAGDYILNVKGTDFSGIESNNTLKIPITVGSIFYKTWWFILLSALLILAIIYGLFQFRVRQILAIEQLRTNISSDLHDNLGSMLSGIAMQSELVEANAKKENKSKLNKIATTSRDAISQMRDLVWSIDNRRERTSDLLERMEELADELLFPKNISFHLEKNNLNFNKKLSITAKQHLFFIYKEAVTNILRHSNAKNVFVKFTNQNGFGKVIISDDGTINKTNKSTGFGLANMTLRAKKMNATINFIKEDGFEIHLKLPFKL